MPYELLLADDSTTIQRAVEITFTKEPQFSLTTLGANQDIAARAVELRPAVVLLASRLPGNDAYSICRSIRQHPNTAHTRIIMLAPEGGDFDPEQAARSGADSHIAKPFDTQTLIDQVKKVVGEPLIPSATTARPLQELRQPAPTPGVPLSAATKAPAQAPTTLAPPPPVVQAPRAEPATYETLAPPPPVVTRSYEPLAPPPPVVTTQRETSYPPPPVTASAPAPIAPEAPASPAQPPAAPSLESLIANAMDKPTSAAPRTVTAPAAEARNPEGPSLEDLITKAMGTPPPARAPSSRKRHAEASHRQTPMSATSALKNLVANAMPNRADDAPAAAEIDLFKRYQTVEDVVTPRTQSAKPTTPEAPLPTEPITEPVTETAIEAAVRKITQETIERIVWEVVPELAEVMIRERLEQLDK